jgi:hypothetical protein
VVIGGICALAAARHIEVLLREGRDGTYRRMDPSEVVELAAETGLESVLKRVGDMDMHFRTMLMALPNPRGVLFLAGLLRSILLSVTS